MAVAANTAVGLGTAVDPTATRDAETCAVIGAVAHRHIPSTIRLISTLGQGSKILLFLDVGVNCPVRLAPEGRPMYSGCDAYPRCSPGRQVRRVNRARSGPRRPRGAVAPKENWWGRLLCPTFGLFPIVLAVCDMSLGWTQSSVAFEYRTRPLQNSSKPRRRRDYSACDQCFECWRISSP